MHTSTLKQILETVRELIRSELSACLLRWARLRGTRSQISPSHEWTASVQVKYRQQSFVPLNSEMPNRQALAQPRLRILGVDAFPACCTQSQPAPPPDPLLKPALPTSSRGSLLTQNHKFQPASPGFAFRSEAKKCCCECSSFNGGGQLFGGGVSSNCANNAILFVSSSANSTVPATSSRRDVNNRRSGMRRVLLKPFIPKLAPAATTPDKPARPAAQLAIPAKSSAFYTTTART